jgi:hypothetical protein
MPESDDNGAASSGGRGKGVDAFGWPVIDPTKNVLNLVAAESKYQDGMRDALEKYVSQAREYESKMQNSAKDAESKLQMLRAEAESKRIDQLAELRMRYDTRIADMLSASVQSTSSLVSTQLVQIQATFDARVSKLEQFRWESGGRSSAADPQLADTLSRMSIAITTNKESEIAALEKLTLSLGALKETGKLGEGHAKGIGDFSGWIATGIATLWAFGATLALVYGALHSTH